MVKPQIHRQLLKRVGFVASALLLPLLLVGTALFSYTSAAASSHREAPLISKDAYADTTDAYVWIPQGITDRIVLAASWIPFEGPEGGPNYYEWDDTAYYDIFVDNNGDAVADITYTLRSNSVIVNPDTFLYNVGPIDSLSDSDWNLKQYYTVTERTSGGTTEIVDGVLVPPANIGSKSTPDYVANLWEQAIYDVNIGGDAISVFAGPTDDAFWVDLQVFDLLTLRGQDTPIGYNNDNNIPLDSLSGFNVHTLVIELPIDRVTAGGEPVIGVWAGTRRAGLTVLDQQAGATPTQVSRLGMPLVNEVVLPLGLKDTFNAIAPSVDLTVYGLLQESVENPEIGTLLCALYGVPLPGDGDDNCNTEYTAGTPHTGRGDIFDIFLTGMVLANPFTITTASGPVELPAGFNVNQPSGVVPAEMMRINTAVSGDLCAPTPSPLGVLGGDACGFPNGRRLTDEVIEIELLAVAGAAYEVLDDTDASFSFNPAFIGVLDDGLNGNDVPFRNTFPYFAPPHQGENHYHENIWKMFMPAVMYTGSAVQSVGQEARQNPVATATALGGTALMVLPALALLRRRRLESQDML